MIDKYVLASNDDGDLAVRTVQATESSSVTDTTSVITATDDGKLAVRVVGSGGGDQHNLGWYATESALTTAHATATDGDWAIVGATDTVWVWDSDSTGWKDTGAAGIELPDQTGKSGEFLTTDGSSASWGYALYNQRNNYTNFMCDTKGQTNYYTNWNTSYHGGILVIGDINSQGSFSSGENQTAIGHNIYMLKGERATLVGGAAQVNGTGSIAFGAQAIVSANYAIQINASGANATNSDANTVKIANANGNFEMMSADGTIPEARLADTTNAQQGDVLTLDSTGNAVWRAGGGGSSPRKNEVFLSPSDWNYDSGEGGYLQVVNVTGVTSQSVVFVAPAPFPQEQQNYASAGVVCVQQGNGTLTFFSPNGSNDMLDVYVVVFN